MVKPLFKNLLVAVNSSESSIHAAMYAIMLSKLYKLNIRFVYVVDTATLKQLTLSKFFVADESKGYEENLLSDGKKYLSYMVSLAESKGLEAEIELRKGAIWSEVIMAADENKSDLILIGGKDNENFSYNEKHNVTYSSSNKLIYNAHCPVLVVHKQDVEQLFKLA